MKYFTLNIPQDTNNCVVHTSGLELGLAERSLMKAVAQSSGRSEKQVLEELEETGDLGIVAQNSCGKQRKLFHPPPLTVPKVFNQLRDLAGMKGKDVSETNYK
jgi:DNA ligase-1